MRAARYIAPAGEFPPEVCADAGRLLAELVEARSRAAERQARSNADLSVIEVLFKMKAGTDAVDAHGAPVNEFGHLAGVVRPRPVAPATWVGPVTVDSLVRVLTGRIEWHPPATRNAQVVIERFAEAGITAFGTSVGALVEWAIDRNTTVRAREWRIDGLEEHRALDAWSLDRTLPSIVDGSVVTGAATAATRPAPADPFDGLYSLVRARVNEMVFGSSTRKRRPQVLPRQPGLALSVAYTVEYLLHWERDDDEIPDGLVDESRHAFARLAAPAARVVDSDANVNALEQLCGRTADTFPEIGEALAAWSNRPVT